MHIAVKEPSSGHFHSPVLSPSEIVIFMPSIFERFLLFQEVWVGISLVDLI